MTKVMLVEDDENLREIYEARLQAEGFEIVTASNGEEALVVAKAEQPELIISDVMMPNISGFDMLDILRNTEGMRDAKVIMLTALGQAEDKTRADKLGADRYLVKSQVTLEDIVKTAHELIDGPLPAQPAPIAAPTEPTAVPVVTDPAQATPAQPVAAPTAVQAPPAPVAPTVQPTAPVTEPVVAPAPPATPMPEPTTPQAPVLDQAVATPQPAGSFAGVDPASVAPAAVPSVPTESISIPVTVNPAPSAPEPAVVAAEPVPPPPETAPVEPVIQLPGSEDQTPNTPSSPENTEADLAMPPLEIIDPSTVQTTSTEESVMKSQIDSFVAEQSDAPEQPTAPSPNAADASSEAAAPEAVPIAPNLSAPTVTPQTEPTVVSPQPAPAMNPSEPVIPTDAITPQESAETNEEDTGVTTNNETGSAAVAHKKVISPLGPIAQPPNINDLLAKEVAMDQAEAQMIAPTPAYPTEPGNVVSPKSPSVEKFDPDDPNSIAL